MAWSDALFECGTSTAMSGSGRGALAPLTAGVRKASGRRALRRLALPSLEFSALPVAHVVIAGCQCGALLLRVGDGHIHETAHDAVVIVGDCIDHQAAAGRIRYPINCCDRCISRIESYVGYEKLFRLR